METISRAVLTASTAAVAITVFDLVSPEKKFNKQLRLIFSLVFILVVFTPVFKDPIDFSGLDLGGEAEVMNIDVDSYVLSMTKENVEKRLLEHLEENGLEAEEISVGIHNGEDGGISITEVKITCPKGTDCEAVKRLAEEETGAFAQVWENPEGVSE